MNNPRYKVHLSSSTGIQFIYYQCALLCGGMGCCQSPSRCHWLRTVRQKKSIWRHLFPIKKRRGGGVEGEKNPHPPHRCERRRQRQTSAQSCGSHWLALCTKSNSKQCTRNTPTNPEGVHAASSIAPPLSHRSPAWRTTTLHFNPRRRRRRRRACEDGSLRSSPRLVLSYFSSRDAVFLR